jgi:hypothetical protein
VRARLDDGLAALLLKLLEVDQVLVDVAAQGLRRRVKGSVRLASMLTDTLARAIRARTDDRGAFILTG